MALATHSLRRDGDGLGSERFLLTGPTALHGHDFLEIAVVLDGDGVHVSREGTAHLSRGSVVLVRPGRWHGFDACRDLLVQNVYLARDVARRLSRLLHEAPDLTRLVHPRQGLRAFHLDGVSTGRVEGWAAQLAEAGPGAPGPVVRTALVVALLGELARHASAADPVSTGGNAVDAVDTVVALLHADPVRRWTQGELAAAVHLSPGHLGRLFTRSLGVTPLAYLDALRAELAAALLLSTSLPVAEVGARVGWDDPNYASRRFRHHVGTTPSRYRQLFVTG